VNTGFVNRLVGTCIVVTAAIIFIPNILDGQKTSSFENFKPIPERPEFTKVDLREDIEQRAQLAAQIKQKPVENIVADDAGQNTSLSQKLSPTNKIKSKENAGTVASISGDKSDVGDITAATAKKTSIFRQCLG
jgi:DedD protein